MKTRLQPIGLISSAWIAITAVCISLFPAGLVSALHAAELRAGAAAVAITPPLGTPLSGYYSTRGAESVLDPLYSKALVLEHGGTRIALVTCDLLTLPRQTVLDSRKEIERLTGIPGHHVMLSATHQHTGPVVARESRRDELDGGNSELGLSYTASLPQRIARSVAEANAKLAPAKLGAGIGHEDGISFNRRFWMRDGTVSWNPGKANRNIVRPAGPIDPEVGVLYFESADSIPLATYVNFAMHPDTTGGANISADFPGALARRLAEYKGPEMVTLFANGACANINHLDVRWPGRQSSPSEAARLGTILAGAVLKTYPRLEPVTSADLRVRSEIVPLPLAPITEADIEQARAVVRRMNVPATTFMEKVKAFQVLDVAAREGQPIEVEVQVIALGTEVAWVSLPGEIFVELGLSIKAASPFRYTLIAELANGSIGYVPNKPAYLEGNYEVVSARCAEGSGEMLVSAALRLLDELHANASPKRP